MQIRHHILPNPYPQFKPIVGKKKEKSEWRGKERKENKQEMEVLQHTPIHAARLPWVFNNYNMPVLNQMDYAQKPYYRGKYQLCLRDWYNLLNNFYSIVTSQPYC